MASRVAIFLDLLTIHSISEIKKEKMNYVIFFCYLCIYTIAKHSAKSMAV